VVDHPDESGHERAEQVRLMGTADFREGIAASLARRPPEFRGA